MFKAYLSKKGQYIFHHWYFGQGKLGGILQKRAPRLNLERIKNVFIHFLGYNFYPKNNG